MKRTYRELFNWYFERNNRENKFWSLREYRLVLKNKNIRVFSKHLLFGEKDKFIDTKAELFPFILNEQKEQEDVMRQHSNASPDRRSGKHKEHSTEDSFGFVHIDVRRSNGNANDSDH